MKRRLVGLILVLVLLIFPLNTHGGDPLQAIQTQVNKVLGILRDPALKEESVRKIKEDKIWALVSEMFHYDELSKRTLARNWKKFNPNQQKEFSDLFGKLLGNVYMDRILAYTDEKVVFGKETMLSEDKAEVQSKIVTPSKEIPIHYRLIMKSGDWKVYDVVIEGVSLVQNYRSQFRQILIKKSPEQLLEMLRKKVG